LRYLSIKPTPHIGIQAGGFAQGQAGYGYWFQTERDSFVSYTWNLGSAGSSNLATPRVYFSQSNATEPVSVSYTTKSGCTGRTDTVIRILGLTGYYFPTSFTPNGDGVNDAFGIAGPEYVKQYKLHIFNRWGEKVFYTENPWETWKPQTELPGQYIYKAVVQDIYSRWKEVYGVVLLVR
ncbi:MAG: gliding motility-associated C-terminal domain-containing protein, partial [Bacteroidetes bacterium]|nr:gliding motility-associated C-terminal domain-containing protein [Bacteroidota bacterium]